MRSTEKIGAFRGVLILASLLVLALFESATGSNIGKPSALPRPTLLPKKAEDHADERAQ
jgi:hypothetical protein